MLPIVADLMSTFRGDNWISLVEKQSRSCWMLHVAGPLKRPGATRCCAEIGPQEEIVSRGRAAFDHGSMKRIGIKMDDWDTS